MSYRTCAYCGKLRADGCRCRYRAKRKRLDGLNAGVSVSCENTSRETTLAEFVESIRQTLPASSVEPEKARGCWHWSFDLAEEATENKVTKGD